MKYWIGVVNKEHVLIGVKSGIMQVNHGKKAPLSRLNKDDWLIYYSPVNAFGDKQPLQEFTAIGQISDNDIYAHETRDGRMVYRRKVNYLKTTDAPIRPLIEDLSFIKNKKSWGYVFRFGLVEIGEEDYNVIKSKMLTQS